MNSYDIIADAVRKYVEIQINDDRCVDYAYMVTFKQSYNPINNFEQCTEIVFYKDGDIEFDMDFCEGQMYVTDIYIMSLREIGDIMNRLVKLI